MNNDKTKELLVENLKKTPIIQLVCEKIGISRASFYRFKKNDKTFAKNVDEAIVEGRQVVNDLAESRLMAAIQSGNLTSVMYWLNHNHTQYSNKLEIRGKIETSTQLTAEQQEDIKKALSLINLKEITNGN